MVYKRHRRKVVQREKLLVEVVNYEKKVLGKMIEMKRVLLSFDEMKMLLVFDFYLMMDLE